MRRRCWFEAGSLGEGGDQLVLWLVSSSPSDKTLAFRPPASTSRGQRPPPGFRSGFFSWQSTSGVGARLGVALTRGSRISAVSTKTASAPWLGGPWRDAAHDGETHVCSIDQSRLRPLPTDRCKRSSQITAVFGHHTPHREQHTRQLTLDEWNESNWCYAGSCSFPIPFTTASRTSFGIELGSDPSADVGLG